MKAYLLYPDREWINAKPYFDEKSISQDLGLRILYMMSAREVIMEGENVKEIGTFQNLRGACLDLNQTPGFVFYVRAEYEGELAVNGTVYREFSDPVMKGGEMLKYVVVEIPAYRMTEDITVVAGEDTLLYNLDTYIATVASAEPYAHALYGYVVACKNYLA